MEKVISFQTSNRHYTAEACIVWCFDDRFTGALERLVAHLKLKNFDLVKIAGGAKFLAVSGESSEKSFVLNQIQTSIKLHGTKRVILMTHSDCGAYGGLKAFEGSAEKEMEAHKKELENARDFLKTNLPEDTEIKIIFVNFEDILSF